MTYISEEEHEQNITTVSSWLFDVDRFNEHHQKSCTDMSCYCRKLVGSLQAAFLEMLEIERAEGFGRDFGMEGLEAPCSCDEPCVVEASYAVLRMQRRRSADPLYRRVHG